MNRIVICIATSFFFSCAPSSEGEQESIQGENRKVVIHERVDTVRAIRPLLAFKNDTLKYLRGNFIFRKSVYLGHRLEKLFNDLDLPVRGYTLAPLDTKKIDEFQSLGLKLDDGATVISKYDGKKVPNILVIKLKYPVPYSEGQKVNAASKGRFTSDAKTFFASREISDILLIDE